MKASIIKIGNSQGIRIPKLILDQCGFTDEIELEVQSGELIIKPLKHPRQNWEKSFELMAVNGDDTLLDFPSENKWDGEEWEWK